jgi:3-methyl-2-oxobutanoate hydroxymethyltransferase
MSATSNPESAMVRRLTVTDIARMHADGERIPMLTAYDYPTAKILDEAGIPMLLVGDSLGRAMLGYENELSVTMEDMLHHASAVTRGARRAVVVGDMPFLSYATPDDALRNAGRFVHDASVHAVKVEGGVRSARIIETLVKAGIPVMAHIGLTPQSANAIGKFRIQGKTRDQARALLHDALAVQEAGAFSVVLELVPEQLAAAITERLGIPTIGIGAGAGCSGQVQIVTDLLGLDTWHPKHARAFVNLHELILGAVREYAAEVAAGTFPGPEQTVRMDDAVLDEVLGRSPLDAAGGRHATGDMPAGGIPLDRDL